MKKRRVEYLLIVMGLVIMFLYGCGENQENEQTQTSLDEVLEETVDGNLEETGEIENTDSLDIDDSNIKETADETVKETIERIEPTFNGTYKEYNQLRYYTNKYGRENLKYLGETQSYALFTVYEPFDREFLMIFLNKDHTQHVDHFKKKVDMVESIENISMVYVEELGGKMILLETKSYNMLYDMVYNRQELLHTVSDDEMTFIEPDSGEYIFEEGIGLSYTSVDGDKAVLGCDNRDILMYSLGEFRDSDNNLYAIVSYDYLDEEINNNTHFLWDLSSDNPELGSKEDDGDYTIVEIRELAIDNGLEICKEWYIEDNYLYMKMCDTDREKFGIGKVNLLDMDSIEWSMIEMDEETNKSFIPDLAIESVSFDENKYAYVTEDYRLILVLDGHETDLYKGYYKEGIGGVGIYVSIPYGLEFSESGDYISFFLGGYEWNDGPFIYDMKGDYLYSPDFVDGDYVSGRWIDENLFFVDVFQSFNTPIWVLDFNEMIEKKYRLTNVMNYSISIDGRILIEFQDSKSENLSHYFIESSKNSGVFYDVDLKQSIDELSGAMPTRFVEVGENTVLRFDIEKDKLIISTLGNMVINKIRPLVEEKTIYPKNDMVHIGNNLYVQKVDQSIEYYYLSEYNGYVFLDSIDIEEVRYRTPDYWWWYNDEVRNFDNKVVFDRDSGHIVEYETLVKYMNGKDFEIVSGDFLDQSVYYMIKYLKDDEIHVELVYKEMALDDFVQIDTYILPQEYDGQDLTILLTMNGVVDYDYYDSEVQEFEIKEFKNGSYGIKYKNAMNMRRGDYSRIVYYYDIELGKYVGKHSNLKGELVSDLAFSSAGNGLIGRRIDESGDMILSVEAQVYDFGGAKALPYQGELNIGQDILVKAELFYDQFRLETIHFGENGELELVVHELMLEKSQEATDSENE